MDPRLGRRSSARAAGPAARALVALAVLAGVGVMALWSAPPGPEAAGGTAPAAAEPVDRLPSAAAGPDAGAPDGRPRLRSVTTAPTRPRLGPLDPGHDPEVVLHQAVLRLDDVDAAAFGDVTGDPDVAHAAALHVEEVVLSDGRALVLGLVEPAAFRSLAPAVTAQAPGVWEVLARGDVLLSPDVAARLGARAGAVLPLAGGGALRVGGAASNGAPPLVDVLAAREPGAAAGGTVLVAVHPGSHVPDVAERLVAATGAAVRPLPPAEPRVASLVGGAGSADAFEPFPYREADGGRIAIDPGWVAAHITRAHVPILGELTCHRLLFPQLQAALQRIADDGLADLLDPDDHAGCHVPRHVDWNRTAALSMHAWGLAVDVNVSTNGLGEEPQLDPRVVAVFEDHGFSWGGRWRRPDGMHFELARLLTAEELAALAR